MIDLMTSGRIIGRRQQAISKHQREKREGRSATLLPQLMANLTGVLTISGLIIFMILSVLYEKFYSEFGVAPSDVGIGYVETLSRSYGFVVLLALFTLTLAVLLRTVLRIERRFGGRDRRRDSRLRVQLHGSRVRKFFLGHRGFIRRYFGVLFVIYLSLYGVLIVNTLFTWYLQEDVYDLNLSGEPVSPYRWCSLTILDIKAQKADLGAGTAPDIAKELKGRELFYLGMANRVYILYDATGYQVWRFSAEKLTLRIDPEKSYPGCVSSILF
jgi:hypothetical protein